MPKLREVIDESIEVTFDTYLQFDSFQQLPPGTTFNYMRKIFLEMDQLYILDYCRSQQTIEEDSSVQFLESASFDNKSGINLLTAKHLADCSKISIIYSQIHHIASQFPQDQIIMHFYDDKENILENLYQFYSQNPIWIPNDFKLCLFQQKALEGNVPSSIGKTNRPLSKL